METNKPQILMLGAALLLAPLTSTLAQSTWETVDALTPWRGRAIAADGAGNFISLAIDDSTSSTGPVSTAVSLSSDTGLNWQTVGSIPGYALKLTSAPDGTLYASGNRSASASGKAFVWFSRDHGATWTVSDPWAGQGTTLLSSDLAAGNSGAVYLCGFYATPRWIVRKGVLNSTGGITWTTVDNSINGDPKAISVRPGAAGQPDQIFACGGAPSLNGWGIRRSLDGGATWATVDANAPADAYGIVAGADGSTYAIGRYLKSVNKTTQVYWLVRKSSNGGNTWSTVDSFSAWPASGKSLTVDVFGRVFAIGFLSATTYTWVVRGSIDGGATWTTTDTFLPPGYTSSQALEIASDSLGNICVVGDVENGTPSADLASIRRLVAP